MDFDQIKQILDLVREHSLAEFELESDGMKIRVRKESGAPVVISPDTATISSNSATVRANSAAIGVAAPESSGAPASPDLEAGEAEEESVELAVVKSPIVGTFYRAADPSSPAFVELGDTVRKGQVLCIIEAMKLMNEIESEHEGEVVNIYVENGQPVQYGERLFAIRRH